MAEPKLYAETEYIHQLVYDLNTIELQIILEAIKQNKIGNKQSLRRRVLSLLSSPSSTKTRNLRRKILHVYQSRPENYQLQQRPSFNQPSQQSNNFLSFLRQPSTYNLTYGPNNPMQPLNEIPTTPSAEFEHLPFFKTMQTLLMPMYCQSNMGAANFTGLYFLSEEIRHSIVKSWSISRQEYEIQIILRFVRVRSNENTDGVKENIAEHLPYNITVSVNNQQCKLPTLNIPTKAGITPWRCNVPVDITQQTNLRNCLQNKLQVTWSEEPHEYMACVFVAQKLTSKDLLIELKKRPYRASNKTKELIKKSMEGDADMGVDSIFATVKDPLSKTRMRLPARGKNCIHMQCFDAIQFLQMNEQKQTWTCPLCKNKVKFEDIEVDEFFLNILESPNLSKECENVILLEDGTWSEKKSKEFSKSFSTNDNRSTNSIEVFTLSDSDDDDDKNIQPRAKYLKYDNLKTDKPLIKSENIEKTTVITKTNENKLVENDLVLDLSLKNSTPSTSSNYQSVITLNDSSKTLFESSNMPNYYHPNITITHGNKRDCKPNNFESSKHKKCREKDTSRPVICVITLD